MYSHASPPIQLTGWTSYCLELDASGVSDLGSSGVTTHVNKVHHVTTITQIARDLGEDEDSLCDIANEMEIEDGVIYEIVGGSGILAFTDFGIENLIELIKMHKNDPTIQRKRQGDRTWRG